MRDYRMKYTENALNILTAKTFKGIGNAWINKNFINKNLSYYEDIVEVLKKNAKEEVTENIFLEKRRELEEKLDMMSSYCDGVVAVGDNNFPVYTATIKDSEKPNVLFYKGDLSLLSNQYRRMAVIGVLTPSEQIEKDERQVVDLLSKQNIVIVSGLALGCDTIAHQQALRTKTDVFGDTHAATIAILPSTLNNIIPAQNRKLAEYVNLLITEYYEEPQSKFDMTSRFIERDRLQALFSETVILSASYTPNSIDPLAQKIDSGSRHAMQKAREYGLGRAVIHSQYNQNDPKYDLNRQIINENYPVSIIDLNNLNVSINTLLNQKGESSKLEDSTQTELF